MTQLSKWKTIGYAVAIFIAGGISGGAIGLYKARNEPFQPRDPEITMRIRDRLKARLGLTAEQIAKIDPIIAKTTQDLHAIRVETMDRVNKVFDDSYTQISALLTPGQKAKLDEMQRERRVEMTRRGVEGRWHGDPHHRGPGGPGGDGGPGGPP